MPIASIDGDRRIDDRLHDVDVVDHQVQDDVHVRAALAVRRQPVAFDEARPRQVRLGRQNGRVEALEMAHLQDALLAPGQLDERGRLFLRLGDRLLDQHVCAGVEEVACDREMRGRLRDDAHRIDAAQQLAIVRERGHAELRRNLVTSLRPRIHHGDQLAAGDLGIFLSVEAAEIADTDDRCSDFLHWGAIMPARTRGDAP